MNCDARINVRAAPGDANCWFHVLIAIQCVHGGRRLMADDRSEFSTCTLKDDKVGFRRAGERVNASCHSYKDAVLKTSSKCGWRQAESESLSPRNDPSISSGVLNDCPGDFSHSS